MNRRQWLFALGSGAARAAAAPVVAPGWDWWLPASVRPLPYSGYVTWGGKRFSEMITVFGVQVPWSSVSRAPGEYDFSGLENSLREARAAGVRVGLHVKGVERRSVPDWVIQKYHVPVLDVIPLQENQPWRLQIVPPWHPDVAREYAAFLRAFAKTGIPQRADVLYGYIHGISPSRGEELFLRPVDIDAWEKSAGLTPSLLAGCLRARLDAMLEAFRGVESKLAWMSAGPLAAGQKGHEEYARQTAGLAEYAFQRGTGWRGGGIDFQNVLLQAPHLGSTISADGYVLSDESVPLRDGKRYLGDENEEYGRSWEWRFGPYEKHAYRHRICCLHGVQLGQNFQMVSPETLKLNPELNVYVQRTQGRRAENSPDAWAYLRECTIRRGDQPRTVKNLERYLLQRDVDGSRSVACERVDRYALSADAPGYHYDLDARRTDIANRQDGLHFQLEARFWPRPAPALVKVTFTDRAPAAWRIEFAGGNQSPVVQNSGDGALKTATFSLPALAGEFRLVTKGPGDLTVTFVRVIAGSLPA
jgi:hypothetical protein